jgi:peptidyl-prolyl cis-trans isomerase D
VQEKGFAVTDKTVRSYIQNLPFFQVDGKFSKQQYKAFLASQNLISEQFVQKIRTAIMMEQFQRGVMESGFATDYDVDKFYALQNQIRNIQFVQVALKPVTEKPTEEEINNYYQENQDKYKTDEQVAIEYIDLSLDELAKDIDASDEQLQEFYEQQKELYSTKERRKISHILFSFKKYVNEEEALKKAKEVKQQLQTEDFAEVAKQVSDDTLTAGKGGDLGLFNVGAMEPAFEETATKLNEGEVSDPVKSAFGYHLIKVTELKPGITKPFEQVKNEVAKAYKRAQAESIFYELSETLAEVSYENPDNLEMAADAVGIKSEKTALFTRTKGTGIAAEEAIRNAAFSEEVLKGNNSEPVELGSERIVVLRVTEHKPASVRPLQEVRVDVEKALLATKAKKQALATAKDIKQRLIAGESLDKIASDYGLVVKKHPKLSRKNTEVPVLIKQAAFKLAKPKSADAPSVGMVDLPEGGITVVGLFAVVEGQPSAEDEKQRELIRKNLSTAYGRLDYSTVIKALEEKADIVKRESEQ